MHKGYYCLVLGFGTCLLKEYHSLSSVVPFYHRLAAKGICFSYALSCLFCSLPRPIARSPIRIYHYTEQGRPSLGTLAGLSTCTTLMHIRPTVIAPPATLSLQSITVLHGLIPYSTAKASQMKSPASKRPPLLLLHGQGTAIPAAYPAIQETLLLSRPRQLRRLKRAQHKISAQGNHQGIIRNGRLRGGGEVLFRLRKMDGQR